jgi:pimeloyl-ACP methyl ester carboxylesterase
VLETGLGAESNEWTTVRHAIQVLTRVCSYDRAGRGASDRASSPRSAVDMVDDLHKLLGAAEIPHPYVLVGHSLGGLLMRLYASRHRDEVAGLVLVDSMHEDQFDVFGEMFPPPTPADPLALQQTRAFWTGGWREPASTEERIDLVSSITQVRRVVSLGDIPLHVITAGTFLNQSLIPSTRRVDLQRRWEDLQKQFLKLSSRATHWIVHSSGHFVQRDDPQVVIDAIRALIGHAAPSVSGPTAT